MIIDASRIKSTETIVITGEEGWLTQIYASFPTPKGQAMPKLTGSFLIDARDPMTVNVRGTLEYAPFVDCSRCALEISWPINESIDVRFLREAPEFEDELEIDLEAAGLEDYILDNGKTFDLEILLNDAIQLSLPTKLIKVGEDNNCLVCSKDLSAPLALESNPAEDTNPFAVLKGIKLN